MTRILVVEDSPDLAFGLRTNLEIEGYDIRVAGDGRTALREFDDFRPDLVVLDLMIPELNGYGVLQSLRERGSSIPVCILSATAEEAAKIRGFRLGADDFVTKPFSVLELLARIEALLRRANQGKDGAAGSTAGQQQFRFGDVEVDLLSRRVYRFGDLIDLSPKAYDLFVALMNRRGGVARREELLREVWGHRREISTRTVDAHIVELRRKLEEDAANPRHFLTVRKAGYRFQQ
jgi:two-component system, OmpR family, alkaline phosphatase synthesis response regulator PhoP